MSETHAYEIVGRRIWMTLPYGSPVKDRIKSAGAHWDSASKRWWIGTVARDIVVPIMEEAMGTDAAELVTVAVDLDAARSVVRCEGGTSSQWARYQTSTRSLTLDGVPLATWTGFGADHKTGRAPARLSDYVVVTQGEIAGFLAGSRRKPDPTITWDGGTIVRVEVSEPVAQRWIEQGYAALPGTVAARAEAV